MSDRLDELEKENASLRKINRVLMDRVERSIDSSNNAFGVFEHNILLQKHIEQRTAELRETSSELARLLENQRRISSQLAESKARLDQLARHSRTIAWEIDPEGRFTYISSVVEPVLGYRPEDLVGGACYWELCPEKNQDRFKKDFLSIINRQEKISRLTRQARTKNGSRIWLSTNALPLLGAKGELLGYRGSDTDISEQKQAEQERETLQAQLLQAQKMESVGLLAGGIAHDFNNLLQAISGQIQLLVQNKPEDHPDLPRLKSVASSIDRAAQLVKQLLFFSRKAEVQSQPLDLNAGIKDTLKMLKRTIPRMISIEFLPGEDLWQVCGDPVQVEQVVLNLGRNAADAMPDGGTMTIETANTRLDTDYAKTRPDMEPGEYVLMSVSDTGRGMDKETVKHIFDPFFTTKKQGQGTGLGLASVYGIVKKHGGHILCYSRPGQGTTFKIYWPVSYEDSRGRESAQNTARTSLQGSETIMIVEDEEEIRELTSEALQEQGYRVIPVSNGEEALEIFHSQKQPVHLVILDLNMPGMGGHQCLEELMARDPHLPVLISSGYSAAGLAESTSSAGASGFIGKPYHLTELLTEIRRTLDSTPER
ncbi:MAG: response regulator [Desulfonatronovibrionaceae bacterium]